MTITDSGKHHERQIQAENAVQGERVDKSAAERTGSDDLEKPLPKEDNAVPVQWTFTRVIAVIALCLVYVGWWHRRFSRKLR